MAKPVLDAIAVAAKDMAKTKEFYTLLGFDFEGEGAFDGGEHIEPARRPGEPRLMIDEAKFMAELIGEPPHAPNHSIFAMLCETPAEVDAVVAQIEAAGFAIAVAPWDAFWGQRYATVVDPDGYKIDIFAELPKDA